MAGSPYAIKDYFDVDPDLADDVTNRMSEFGDLVSRIHEAGMKVIIDFIPNHVARDYTSVKKPTGVFDLGEGDIKEVSFHPDNNFYYLPDLELHLPCKDFLTGQTATYGEIPARVTGNDVFHAYPSPDDWYETIKLNYGIDPGTGQLNYTRIPDTWLKMKQILQFWLTHKVDGFRCDMAGMVPVAFWSYLIQEIKTQHPKTLFIAELYEPDRYRDYIEVAGFDFLYDKVGLYDTLHKIICDGSSTSEISQVWRSLQGLDPFMLRFIENHDEVRLASRHFGGDYWKGIAPFALSALMHNGPILLYAGQEVGEQAEGATGFSGDDGRTSIFDYWILPELQKWYNHGLCDGARLSADQKELRKAYQDILVFSRSFPVLSNGMFYDLTWYNEPICEQYSLYAFLRHHGAGGDSQVILIVISFQKSTEEVCIKIPEHALEQVGLAEASRIQVRKLYPANQSETVHLISEMVSIGVRIPLTDHLWSAWSLSD